MNAPDAMRPDGYQPHTRRSPLTDPWEPVWARETSDAVDLGLDVRAAHCNARGFAHGGLISSLADNAMGGSAVRLARRRPDAGAASAVTVTLSVDFIDVAHQGDFIEFRLMVLKVGRTLVFCDCRVVCGERLIARASASFRMV